MGKIIRLTESDLMRVIKRVVSEHERFGTFDDEEWYDEMDRPVSKDSFNDDDFDDETFDEFESFYEKHPDTKWFDKNTGKKFFDIYKEKSGKPFKVRTRRGK